MSNLDERIVSLKFDGSNFESGATKATGILDRLNESLKFKDGFDGLNSLKRASNQFNMNGVENSISIVSSKFSVFQEFVTGVFRHLGERAADFGVGLVKKTTLSPLMQGFSEYELQMRSIQTISANTGLSGKEGIDKINAALDELNTYADKTIYNFSEMAKNVGTFTAAGVDLDTSTKAIQGIANLAAVSGASSEKASGAMYQLSQAIASGTVKLQDWNSVVTAQMGGAVFQNALIRTARAHGIAVDDMIKKNGTFRESLKEGWLTTEVLTDTLSQLTISYEEVGDEAYNAAMQELLNSNYSKQDAEDILELAKTAEEAATMVRTWSQLWETVGEALGSGWAMTFRIIIGDFNKATEVFTYLSKKLEAIINASSEARNAVLSVWASDEVGGRDALFGALVNIITAIERPLSAIADSFSAVFGMTGQELATVTEDFARFTEKLVITNDQANHLAEIFDSVFGFISDGLSVASMIGSGFLKILGKFAKAISPSIKKISDFVKSLRLSQDDMKSLSEDFDSLFSILSGGISIFSKIVDYFVDLGIAVGNAFAKVDGFHRIVQILKNVSYGLYKILRPIGRAFTEAFGIDVGSFDGISDFINDILQKIEDLTFKFNISDQTAKKIHDTFSSLFDIIKKLGGPISDLTEALKNFFSGLFDSTDEIDGDKKNPFEKISEWFSGLDFGKMGLGAALGGAIVIASKAFGKLFEIIQTIRSGGSFDLLGIGDMLDTVRDSLEQYQNKLKVSNLVQIGLAVALLAGSLWVLASIDGEQLANSLLALMTVLISMVGTLKQIGGLKLDTKGMATAAVAMIAMGLAIGLLSLSLKLLSTIDAESLANSLLALMTIMVSMVGALNNMPDSGKLISSSVAMIAMGLAIGMLSLSLKLLSTIDAESLANSLLALMTIMLSMVGTLNNMPDSGKLISSSVAMIAMALAIGMLSLSLKLLSTIDAESLANSLLALMTIMLSMVGTLNMMPDSGKLISSSVAMIAMGLAIGMLSLSLKLLSTMEPESLANSLLALMTIMVVVVGSLNALDTTKMGLLSASIAVVAFSIKSLTDSLVELSGVDPGSLANSLLALMTVVVVLIGAMALLSGIAAPAIGIGVALIALSVAVGLLALSLKLLSTIDPASLAVSLLAFITTMIVVIGAMALMSGMSAPALAFAAVMLAISVAALIFANAIKVLAIAFSIFTAALPVFVSVVGSVLKGIGNAISSAVEKATSLATGFIDAVKSFFGIGDGSSSEMLTIGGNIVQGLITGIGNFIPSIISTAGGLVQSFFGGLGDFVGGLKDKASKGIGGFVDTVGSKVENAKNKAGEVANGIIDGVKNLKNDLKNRANDAMNAMTSAISGKVSAVKSSATKIKDGIESAFKNIASTLKSKVSSAMDGVKSAIEGAKSKVASAASGVVTSITNVFSGIYDKFKGIGENIGNGLKVGIDVSSSAAVDRAHKMGKAAVEAAKAGAEEKSPSRFTRQVGVYIGEGLILGMSDRMKQVEKSGYGLGKSAVESCNDAIQKMSLSVNNLLETDYNPVISPVIDPTQFNSDLSSLNRAMNTNMNRIVLDGMNYNTELNAKMVDYADSNNKALQAIADGVIDYNLLGTAVATALINSGLHVEMDGGQLMGYLAGEIRDVRRMYG